MGPSTADLRANKRTWYPNMLVTTAKVGADEDVDGLDVLLGQYMLTDRSSAGQPVFEKTRSGLPGSGAARPCFLYYWDDPDDEENVGWWFGEDVGASMVFCFARKRNYPPPISGWCIPAEEEIPVKCLRVTPQNGGGGPVFNQGGVKVVPAKRQRGAPNAGGETRPCDVARAWQPPPPPPARRPPQVEAAGGGSRTEVGAGHANASTESGAIQTLHMEVGSEDQPLGVKLTSEHLPPIVLEVRAGSLAHENGIKPGFELLSVNGQLVDADAVEYAMEMLRKRPLVLEMRDPGPDMRVQSIAATALAGPAPPSLGGPPPLQPGRRTRMSSMGYGP